MAGVRPRRLRRSAARWARTNISEVDKFTASPTGPRSRCTTPGCDPVEEVVFFQSDKLKISDPAFRAAVQDVTRRLSEGAVRQNVKSPLTGASAVSADGHAALVDFHIAGDTTEATDRVDPDPRRGRRGPGAPSGAGHRQFGGASAGKAINEDISGDLAKAGDAVAAGHPDPPHASRSARSWRPACRCGSGSAR